MSTIASNPQPLDTGYEITADTFTDLTRAVVNPNGESVLWDDFRAAEVFHKENPHLHVYTITETDGIQILSEGASFVNRLFYVFCENKVELPLGHLIWWPEA